MATVYKILSPLLDECYVGSTIVKVEYRWTQHRSNSNACNSSILFKKHGYDNCKFVVLEVCPLEEQHKKEQWWIDHSVGAVNSQGAIFNKEKRKQYHQTNKEKRNDQSNCYYEENKEEICDLRKQYYEANKDEICDLRKQYYEANKERINERRRMRRKAKKDSPSAE